MKTIGMIGGMSWESTLHYYRIMNQYVREKRGAHSSIEAVIYSFDFERILEWVNRDEWNVVGERIGDAAVKLKGAGADFVILTSNAAHKVYFEIEEAAGIPILHIVDPTANAIRERGIKKIGLLGTQVTMEEGFYRERLLDHFGIETILPKPEERKWLHSMIFDELTVGKIRAESGENLVQLIEGLSEQGAEGVILGCTELALLISQKDTPVPLFDTTDLHAKAAVDAAL